MSSRVGKTVQDKKKYSKHRGFLMLGWLGWVSEMHPTVPSVSISSETQGAQVEEV